MKDENKVILRRADFIFERLQRVERELDVHANSKLENEKKINKLDGEKKKFAAAKKFKDAK